MVDIAAAIITKVAFWLYQSIFPNVAIDLQKLVVIKTAL